MKLYTFTANQYLSPIQCGIQSTHACSELYANYCDDPDSLEFQYFDEWAHQHKTAIFLRGGNCVTLGDIYEGLKGYCADLQLPLVVFGEDETLNYARTAIGLIVPDEETILTDSAFHSERLFELKEFLSDFSLV